MLDVSRHRELFNPEKFNDNITIIGAGATGSWLALALAKLGIKGELITVWDFDIVEEHNVPNQVYGYGDVNSFKVNTLHDRIAYDCNNSQINAIPKKYINQRLSGYVFLMVDSMAERKRIWEEAIKLKTAIKLLIEPRMGLDVGRIYNVIPTTPKHIEEYEKTYYTDDVAEVSACGNSMTVISSALAIAAWCTRQLINFHNDVELDNEILIDFKYNNIVTNKW